MAKTFWVDLTLCGTCAVVIANDDWSSVEETSAQPLTKVPADWFLVVDGESLGFSWYMPCDSCGVIGFDGVKGCAEVPLESAPV